MGKLTTHVLDTANGVPGSNMSIRLFRIDQGRTEIKAVKTNHDGRCDQPLLEGEALTSGVYELEFSAGEYFQARGTTVPKPAFVGDVVLRFGIADTSQHYMFLSLYRRGATPLIAAVNRRKNYRPNRKKRGSLFT